jgi:hypothetical protein
MANPQTHSNLAQEDAPGLAQIVAYALVRVHEDFGRAVPFRWIVRPGPSIMKLRQHTTNRRQSDSGASGHRRSEELAIHSRENENQDGGAVRV